MQEIINTIKQATWAINETNKKLDLMEQKITKIHELQFELETRLVMLESKFNNEFVDLSTRIQSLEDGAYESGVS